MTGEPWRWRCSLAAAGAWLLLLFASTFLRGAAAEGVGLVLAAIGAPVGLLVCCLPVFRHRPRARTVIALPLLAGLVFYFTYLIPAPPVIGVGTWVLGGALAGATAVALLARYERLRPYARGVVIGLGTVWWSCWAIASVAAIPWAVQDTPESWCANKLKLLAYEAARHGRGSGGPRVTVDQLLAAGRVKPRDLQCPLGQKYAEVNARAANGETYWLMCVYHPHVLILTQSGRVITLSEDKPQSRPKIGPKPWWL